MASLDDCLDLVQQGTIAFAVGSAGFVYLNDQARLVQRWWSFVSERRRRSRAASAPLREEEAGAIAGSGENEGAARDGTEVEPGAAFVVRPRRVERVVVRSGALIDAVSFFYEGVPTGETYGGQGGTEHPAFELGPSEWIAEVRGRRGAYIDSLQLVSNTGRASPVYGGSGGEQFSFKAPDGAAIGGLEVAVSVNGWLRSIRGVIEVSKVQLHPPETPIYVRENGIVRAHQRRVRKRLRFLHLSVVAYAAFLIFSMSGFVLDLVKGPTEVTAEGGEPRGIVRLPAGAPVVADSLSFADGQELVRWVIVDLAGQEQQEQQDQTPPQQQQRGGGAKSVSGRPVLGMLVKEVVERAAAGVPATPGSWSNKAADRSPATAAGRTQPGTAAEKPPPAVAARGPSYRRTGVVRRLDLAKDVLVFDEFVDSPLFRWLWGFPAEQQQEHHPEEQAAPRAEHPSQNPEYDDGGAVSARRKAKGRISGQGAMYPRYFVDESFSPALVYLTSSVVLAVFLYTLKTELRQSTGRGDPVIARFELGAALLDAAADDAAAAAGAAGGAPGAGLGRRPPRDLAELAREVDMEVLEPGALVLPWSSSLVAVTRNWLIKTTYLGLDAVAIADARLVDLRVSGRWIMGELVEIVTLRIESRASVTQSGHHRGRAAYFFDVALPRMQFELLQQGFVERVNRGQERHVAGLEQRFLRRFRDMLRLRAAAGVCFEPVAVDAPPLSPMQPLGLASDTASTAASAAADADAAMQALSASVPPGAECLGACGLPPTVIINKRCDSCEERDGCLCQASWCHECIVKWWCTKNRTKLELILRDDGVDPTWQSRCPTCRVWFCLNDLVPRRDIADFIRAGEDAAESRAASSMAVPPIPASPRPRHELPQATAPERDPLRAHTVTAGAPERDAGRAGATGDDVDGTAASSIVAEAVSSAVPPSAVSGAAPVANGAQAAPDEDVVRMAQRRALAAAAAERRRLLMG